MQNWQREVFVFGGMFGLMSKQAKTTEYVIGEKARMFYNGPCKMDEEQNKNIFALGRGSESHFHIEIYVTYEMHNVFGFVYL